jgi:hypothetical protein
VGQFRLLCPHAIGPRMYEAGEIVDTDDLPGWVPTPSCEPLDDAAKQLFWQLGPRVGGGDWGQDTQWSFASAQHWVGTPGGPPKIYWRRQPAAVGLSYTLVGTSFPPK